MRGFIRTEKRERLLSELRRARLSMQEIATALGCDVAHVRVRLATGDAQAAPAPTADHTIVPRPLSRPAPASATRRPLIDLSRAPSSMEQLYAARGDRS